MKKISLLFLMCLVFTLFSLIYFAPSKAQNKSSTDKLVSNPLIFSKQNDKLKKVPQMIKDSKFAVVNFERQELFQSDTKAVSDDTQLSEVVTDGALLNLNPAAVRTDSKG